VNDVDFRLGELWLRAQAAWEWWTGELAEMVPERLRTALAGSDDAVVIEALDTEIIVRRRDGRKPVTSHIPRDEHATQALRLSVPVARNWRKWIAPPLVLKLQVRDALHRTIRLPAGAGRTLEAILRHEVARQSPMDAAAIYYDYRASKPRNGSFDVDLRIVHRAPVDAVVAILAEAGIEPSRIEFMGDATHADGSNFPVSPAAAPVERFRPRLVPALVALVLFLAAMAVGIDYWRQQGVASELADRVASARVGAIAVQRLEQELGDRTRQYEFLTRQKHNPAAIAVLAAVTRLLPDDAWLYEFELNGNEVRLHGYSADASSLIGLIDSSRDFRDAQLRAPLVPGPKPGLQRFDISFKFKASS